MSSPDEARILYDDQDEEPHVIAPAPLAIKLAVLVLLIGITYIAWGSLSPGSNKSALALATNEATPIQATPVQATGFNASSSDFKTCDDDPAARPDFSIVVSGTATADGHPVVSRVVQFVVVDDHQNYPYGRDVRAQSLCTLQ